MLKIQNNKLIRKWKPRKKFSTGKVWRYIGGRWFSWGIHSTLKMLKAITRYGISSSWSFSQETLKSQSNLPWKLGLFPVTCPVSLAPISDIRLVYLLVEFRDIVFVVIISFRACAHDYVLMFLCFSKSMNVDMCVCVQGCDHDFESLFEHDISIESLVFYVQLDVRTSWYSHGWNFINSSSNKWSHNLYNFS